MGTLDEIVALENVAWRQAKSLPLPMPGENFRSPRLHIFVLYPLSWKRREKGKGEAALLLGEGAFVLCPDEATATRPRPSVHLHGALPAQAANRKVGPSHHHAGFTPSRSEGNQDKRI